MTDRQRQIEIIAALKAEKYIGHGRVLNITRSDLIKELVEAMTISDANPIKPVNHDSDEEWQMHDVWRSKDVILGCPSCGEEYVGGPGSFELFAFGWRAGQSAQSGMVMVPREDLQAYVSAINKLYGMSDETRKAVIEVFGLWHPPQILQALRSDGKDEG